MFMKTHSKRYTFRNQTHLNSFPYSAYIPRQNEYLNYSNAITRENYSNHESSFIKYNKTNIDNVFGTALLNRKICL